MKQTDKNFFDAIPQIGTKELNNLAKEMVSGKPKPQTAIEWLVKQIEKTTYLYNEDKIAIKQAKEMEKEQLRKCYHFAQIEQQKEFSSIYVGMSFEKWYNEIYKNE
ncbi:hypothetical protein UFOVP388_8 [uncultured Caudovirales phage]|uniref:Uncharacterized protein n=1 Tax=uncultured Caudovirales phage TaxID=2100421 RepID=A0A6J7X3L8_9CAUD|nr:hypothetical protein UFOVP388_8 [uncultured Caudovirales phage]